MATLAVLTGGAVAPANAADSDVVSNDETPTALRGLDDGLLLAPAENAGLGTVTYPGDGFSNSAIASEAGRAGTCLRVAIGPGVLDGVEYKDNYCK